MQVGTRVEVDGRGPGMVQVDNEDGTWSVELDDETEGDFTEAQLRVAEDQSSHLEDLRKGLTPPGAGEGPRRELPSGILLVRDPAAEPKPVGWTRFVCFSDTHGLHDGIPACHRPEADVLLHAGDFTNTGELEQVASFGRWLEAYPATTKVVIAGNHDTTFDAAYYHRESDGGGKRRFHPTKNYDCSKARGLLAGCVYLEDSGLEVCGYRIYGSPWQPEFCDWAFNLPRGSVDLSKRWQQIPESVDILMTHGPPAGFCDRTSSGLRVGCEQLLAAIRRRQISVSFAGHIHEGYGCAADDVTLYVNGSTCTHSYRPTNPPIVFDLPPPEELRKATAKNAAGRVLAAGASAAAVPEGFELSASRAITVDGSGPPEQQGP